MWVCGANARGDPPDFRAQSSPMNDIAKLSKFAAIVVILLIGPVMYVVSRAHSLTHAFSRINVGDTPAEVTAILGKPTNGVDQNRGNSDVEYRYSAWPLPKVWVIRFRNGKVVEKTEVSSR